MPVKKLPYIQFYTSDYVRDTRILSLEARAVWMDMLCLMHDGDKRGYLSRAGAPLGVEQVARFCGCSPQLAAKAIEEIIASGVASRDDDGTIYSRRIVRDDKKRKMSVAHGRKGGNPNVLLMVNGGVNQQVNEPDKSPLVYGDGVGISNGVGSVSGEGCGERVPDLVASFGAFWAVYPLKVGKSTAAEAWLKINPSRELFDRIIVAVQAQKKNERWIKDRGKYIPHPTTWLNQRRWEDESPPPADPPNGTEAPTPVRSVTREHLEEIGFFDPVTDEADHAADR